MASAGRGWETDHHPHLIPSNWHLLLKHKSMYSPFDSSARLEFIQQELARQYLSFPDEIRDAYSGVYGWLSGRTPNFDKKGAPSSLDATGDPALDWLNTAREFTYLLPSHHMKVYQTLLVVESEGVDQHAGSILDRPQVAIVDDGCGGGTASVAFISLLVNYQKYKMANQLPVFPVTVSCLGIDPKDAALQIYARFLSECADRVTHLLVDVSEIAVFPGTLPGNAARIIEWVAERGRTHCLALVLANVIRSLTREYDKRRERRRLYDKLGVSRFLPHRWGEDIGAEEIAAVNAILHKGEVDLIVAPLVTAYGPERTESGESRRRWRNEMIAFQHALRSKLGELHRVSIGPVDKYCFKMTNPTESYHCKHRGSDRSVELEYDSGYVAIHNYNYLEDEDWQSILSHDNLLLAWARVRNALMSGVLDDTLEVRLFEANIEESLQKLRSEVLSYQWDALNVAEMLNYRVPKGLETDPRPISMCRLEDQVLATAIVQIKGKQHNVGRHLRSYAYRLSLKQKSENLYEAWSDLHKRFLDDARSTAAKNPHYQVLLTDVSSYYTDIVQSKLFEFVQGEMKLHRSRCSDLARRLIERDCGLQTYGRGIPQSHLVSGTLGNLYLSEVDDLFAPGNRWGIEHFRYVDDMILIYSPDVGADTVLALLDEKLGELKLTRSKKKTIGPMSTHEFLERTAPDELLDRLRKEHNFLLSDLYKLGKDYIRIALDDWWSFVECYQKLLVSVGVYINAPWLSRKLQRNLRWWRRRVGWWRKLEMPEIERLEDLRDVGKWTLQFNRDNSVSPGGWIFRRESLLGELLALLRDSLVRLDTGSELERARAGRRVRFALYRLGQLGFDAATQTAVDLVVDQPWLVHPRRVCMDLASQGCEDLLVEAFDRLSDCDVEEWGYIRAVILKAFADLPSAGEGAVSLLRDAAFNGRTILERTMASESLLLLKRTEGLRNDDLLNAIGQSDDNYLSKNYVLLYGVGAGEPEPLQADLGQARIVNEALQYVRVASGFDDLYRHEPDILRQEFYERDYPDDPPEFEDFPYW